jgi:hypothetical protein
VLGAEGAEVVHIAAGVTFAQVALPVPGAQSHANRPGRAAIFSTPFADTVLIIYRSKGLTSAVGALPTVPDPLYLT